MFLGLLTLITALSISAVAIYYSVAGLVAIFAAAALPIMIMGGVLEVSKLVTAVWLHRYWSQATWWLRTYLSTAVVVLMLITSMGIFGFLSKAHIEQTSASDENFARIETIQKEIDRNLGMITRAENRIKILESQESNTSSDVQSQIDKEQERIDSAYSRIQPAIDEQNEIIKGQTNLYSSQLEALDNDFNQLQAWVNEGTEDAIKRVQGMVGTTPDGDWGFLTSNAVDKWRASNREKREELVQKIASIADGNTTIENARAEIARLRKQADDQIASSNKVIDRLRGRLADDAKAEDIQTAIDEQNERVRTASLEVDSLTEEKIKLEVEYRKLEAEVGPIKYIAEFIYGEADRNVLEEAVRWVIITIIFVFDPLAVLLLIASQYTFEFRRKENGDDDGGWLRQYEQARAQRIVDNPGYTNIPPWETKDEDYRPEIREQESQDVEELRRGQEEERLQEETGDDSVVAEERQVNDRLDIQISSADTVRAGDNGGDSSSGMAVARKDLEDVAESYITANDPMGDVVPETDTAVADAMDIELESDEIQDDDEDTPEEAERRRVYDELDNHESVRNLKQQWKSEHPDLNLKTYKRLYIKGRIDNLPWLEGYEQNSEQDENSLWNKIQQNR